MQLSLTSVTKKGTDVLKVMILGNDSSVFDREEEIDYSKAMSMVKSPSVRTAKGGHVNHMASTIVEPEYKSKRNQHEDMWWSRFIN